MNGKFDSCAISLLLLLLIIQPAAGQIASGGTYVLDQAVIANGGRSSLGGNYGVEGTIAQSVAGYQSNGPTYSIRGGFWQVFFVPTAAMVSVSGRVSTAGGAPIYHARVTLNNGGEVRVVQSNNFGYFRFEDVEVGQTYLLTATGKGHQFAPRAVTVLEELSDVELIALP
jgi:hypothetical protein